MGVVSLWRYKFKVELLITLVKVLMKPKMQLGQFQVTIPLCKSCSFENGVEGWNIIWCKF
jgi:hypothetical protein